jgi:probable rRNA maturation factor
MEIHVTNRQRTVPVELRALQTFARAALPVCLEERGPATDAVLAGLEEVAVVLVSDRQSATLHERFLHEPGPTDVITFAHGEIVIGSGVARAQAAEHGETLTRELCRYIVHGLLHLNGFEDKDPTSAARMSEVQERVLQHVEQTLWT